MSKVERNQPSIFWPSMWDRQCSQIALACTSDHCHFSRVSKCHDMKRKIILTGECIGRMFEAQSTLDGSPLSDVPRTYFKILTAFIYLSLGDEVHIIAIVWWSEQNKVWESSTSWFWEQNSCHQAWQRAPLQH